MWKRFGSRASRTTMYPLVAWQVAAMTQSYKALKYEAEVSSYGEASS